MSKTVNCMKAEYAFPLQHAHILGYISCHWLEAAQTAVCISALYLHCVVRGCKSKLQTQA